VRWAVDLVEAPATLRPALDRALERVAVVPDLDAADALVTDHPGVRAVTAAGDLLGAGWAIGGSASAPSVIEVQAAVDEADERLAETTLRCDRLVTELTGARENESYRQVEVETALGALNESDASMSAIA